MKLNGNGDYKLFLKGRDVHPNPTRQRGSLAIEGYAALTLRVCLKHHTQI